MISHRQVRLVMAILAVILIQTCEQPTTKQEESQAGDLVSASLVHEYNPVEILAILQTMGVPNPGASTGSIRAMKLTYMSSGQDQKLRELSGALIYPADDQEHPLLSIQHGTVTLREDVASVNPLNSSAGMSGLLTAALGYVTLVPDFAGYGDSHEMHPYMHAESLSNSVIDLLRAGRTYSETHDIQLNDLLFLTGYSEGGYATLAAQQSIETELSNEFTLTAVAPMAGAYDLAATAGHILSASSYEYPAYIGFMFAAYDQIYAFGKLSDVFNSPYTQVVSASYNGENEFFEINNQLPQSISELIRADFRMSFAEGTELDYSNAFRENSLLDWSPVTPTHFYHGMADQTVPYSIAEATVANLIAHGAIDVELVGIPDANHSTAGVPALMGALTWFSSFLQGTSNSGEINNSTFLKEKSP